MPPDTAGDDSPLRCPLAYFQRSLPVEKSMADSSPLPATTYTTPPTTAGDESIMSPVSWRQSTFSDAGGAIGDVPVRRGVPRNWGHSAAGGGACAEVVTSAPTRMVAATSDAAGTSARRTGIYFTASE